MKKAFDEVFEDRTKYGTKVKTDEYKECGKHLIIDQGQEQIAGYTDLEEGLLEEVPAIIFGDHTRIIKYVDEPFFLGADGVKVLRSRYKNANYKYLYYALKNANIPNTGYNRHFKWLKKVTIEYPDMDKQAEIVNILDKMTAVIEARQQELQKLDELIKARFVELFGSVKEDRFPKCTLRDVAHIKHGYAFSGEFFSEEDNGIVLVTPGNFALGGGFQEVRNKYFTSVYPDEYVLHAGDLIVTMTDLSKKADTLGYGAIVPDTDKVYLHNQRIGLFDKLDERFNPVFVRWYMQTDEYRLEIVRTSTGSTVHHTSPDRILNSVIFIPPIALQNEFVEFAKQLDKSKFIF